MPCSAESGFQVGLVADLLVSQLPEGMPLYPEGELTDEPEQVLVGELIREAALEGVREELPHSIAVVVDEMLPREGRDDLIDIYADLRRAAEPEGHHHRAQGRPGCGRWARRRGGRSRRCWAARSISTCASAS